MSTDRIKAPKREVLDARTLARFEDKLPLFRDDRRRRPLYFDGRFLAARDLTREQDYFLARQADLGRAGGFGVVAGLMVTEDEKHPGQVRIQAGHGVTPSGELVVIAADMSFTVARTEVTPTIRAKVGVRQTTEPRAQVRSGLYILALRPLEYEANPVAQYPTSLGGQQSTHNGDIIEATAVTLIPYPDLGDPTELRFRRAHAAKEIFVDRATLGPVVDALPLAMLALEESGNLKWVDAHLVRREIGFEAGDILDVSGTPLALREAHMLQYDDHLRDLLKSGQSALVASQQFLALPPAGPLPKAAIDRQRFTQRFFPAEVDVDLSVVPSDELGALIEEARLLPPIDLTDADALRGTSVLVVVPVARDQLDSMRARLVGMRRALLPAAPNLLARRRPLERLMMLPEVRRELAAATPDASPEDRAWRELLDLDRTSDLLWYVRRRNLSAKPSIVSEIVGRPADDLAALAGELADHGVAEEDARRIHPLLWETAGPQVASLPPLFKAAALLALAQVPAVSTQAEATAWARQLVRPPVNATTLLRIFDVPRRQRPRPATATLVRAGIVHELVEPLQTAAAEELGKWETALQAAERTASAAERDTKVRKLLFAALTLPKAQGPR